MRTRLAAAAVVGAALGVAGCATPVLTHDGQVAFQQKGASGAAVMTPNGVQYFDRTDIPNAVVRKSVNEPWRPATGFLLPPDGVLRRTSSPTPVQGHGLLVLIRSSDTLVPSWGGEVLLRVDALVPPGAFPQARTRPTADVVIVLDGSDPHTAALADIAIDDAGERDRVAVVDSAHGRAALPALPGTHQTLLHAALERIVAHNAHASPNARRDLAGALRNARAFFDASKPSAPLREVVLVTDGIGVTQGGAKVEAEARALIKDGVQVTAVGAPDDLPAEALAKISPDPLAGGRLGDRQDAIARVFPPPGDPVLGDVELEISSVPAPARVIEVSGGTAAGQLDRDLFFLGEMLAGEARTEIARVALPQWVAGEPLELTVTAKYKDLATGKPEKAKAVIKLRYSNDIGLIASSRHGDVIAYASALAMVRRLQRNFLGVQAEALGGLRPIVTMQATSLARLGIDRHDAALSTQAEVLSSLLGVVEE
jgi:hypothetical protein